MHPFRAVVETRDFNRLDQLFADDVVCHSPIAFRPYRGRQAVIQIVKIVATVLEDFTYECAIGSDTDDVHALVFNARVGSLAIQGCDFVHTGPDGLIDELTVMLRPLKAVQAFAEHMAARYQTSAVTASAQVHPER
ncbi:MAG: nuclear transport factor 2 family protein [Mycobacterium sp.]